MLSDTTSDAERVQLRLLRAKSPTERATMALRLTAEVVRNAKRAIVRVHPDAEEREIKRRFIELHYGRQLAEAVDAQEVGESKMGAASELIEALRPLLNALDGLGVLYYVGGSIASSMHGAARSTLDVDVAADLDVPTAQELASRLSGEYYVSQAAVADAVRRRSCFNLIHLATSFKVDVFVSRGLEFDRRVLERAVPQSLGEGDALAARIATAEDIILIKLEWFRLGNKTSERQWSDVVAVAKLQADQLDREYLRRSAEEIGVTDLLERLFTEAAANAD